MRTKNIEKLLKNDEIREIVRIGNSINHTNFYNKKTMKFFINSINELAKYKLIKEINKPEYVYYKLTKKGRKVYYRLLDKLGKN